MAACCADAYEHAQPAGWQVLGGKPALAVRLGAARAAGRLNGDLGRLWRVKLPEEPGGPILGGHLKIHNDTATAKGQQPGLPAAQAREVRLRLGDQLRERSIRVTPADSLVRGLQRVRRHRIGRGQQCPQPFTEIFVTQLGSPIAGPTDPRLRRAFNLARQRDRVGPMLPMGMPSAALISS